MIDGVSRLLQQHNENDERRWKPSELRANLRQLSNPFPRRPSKPHRRSCKFDRRAARLARNALPPCDRRDCGAGIAEQLTDFRSVLQPMRRDAVPALAALARVAPLLERRGYRWGPGRSVDFELATGAATATPSSDLDVILRQAHRLEPHEADALRAVLVQAAAPARIDVLLETPHGDVSLADLAAKPTHVLVRTPHGARLMGDPWIAHTSSVLIRAVP